MRNIQLLLIIKQAILSFLLQRPRREWRFSSFLIIFYKQFIVQHFSISSGLRITGAVYYWRKCGCSALRTACPLTSTSNQKYLCRFSNQRETCCNSCSLLLQELVVNGSVLSFIHSFYENEVWTKHLWDTTRIVQDDLYRPDYLTAVAGVRDIFQVESSNQRRNVLSFIRHPRFVHDQFEKTADIGLVEYYNTGKLQLHLI